MKEILGIFLMGASLGGFIKANTTWAIIFCGSLFFCGLEIFVDSKIKSSK